MECTNDDKWNCKYCRKVESCEANKAGTTVSPPITVGLGDSERLEWLMRNASGKEFRRLGVTYGGNCGRDRIDAAMNAGEPEWQNDVQAAFGGIVQTPQG